VRLSSFVPRLLVTAAVFFTVASCSENLDSSPVCDVLCPPVGGDVQNVTIDAVVVDTTVDAVSGLGTEPGLLLANRGDTLDARVVLRFDTIPDKFVPTGDTLQPITTVDSAFIRLRIDTLSIKGPGPVTIEAYDVDTTADDTSTAAVLALFRPDRFISSQTFTTGQLTDTLNYFISDSVVLAKLQAGQRLRIGLRATGPSSQMRIFASEDFGNRAALLMFRATPDTATKPLTVTLLSRTPVEQPQVAANLADYTIIAKAPPQAPPTVLAVGGLPARRVYFRFVVPSNIVDSARVVRATLLLNQIPNNALDPTDTVRVLTEIVLAGAVVTDPEKAAQIVSPLPDTLLLRPGDSGTQNVELSRAVALWRTQTAELLPRAIVLAAVNEGNSPLEIRFSSTEDVAALRPRLRISYTSQVPLGLP
jgi:hypothetical protein